MIELKGYYTPNSIEIQSIWESNQWLFVKVTQIAYKLLITNAGFFFYNQSATVGNYLKGKIKLVITKMKPTMKPTKEAAAPDPPPDYASTFFNAVLNALCTTLAFRLCLSFIGSSISLRSKAPQCGTMASFSWINQIKQLELKRFALASAAILFVLNTISAISKEPQNLPLTIKVKNVTKKQWNTPYLIFFSSMITLSLANPLYARALGLTSKEGFDTSGHLMLKTVLAPIVGAALSQAAVDYPRFAASFAWVYTVTDGIFIMNTASYCHTALELLAGFAWGIGIIETSSILARAYVWFRPASL